MDFSKELLVRKIKWFNGPEVELKTYVIVDNIKNFSLDLLLNKILWMMILEQKD